MKPYSTAGLDKAFSALGRAEALLLKEIQSTNWNCLEVINGLDKLEHAIRFVENPDIPIQTCTNCGSIYNQPLKESSLQCLDCDHEWGNVLPKTVEDPLPESNIDAALCFLEESLQVLETCRDVNLQRSIDTLRESIRQLARMKNRAQ